MSRQPASASSSYRSSILPTAHSRMAAALLISVTTGHIRWGMSLNWLISTIFGSTRTSLSSLGFFVYRKLITIVFMQTDLPEPVVPAISTCGIFVRSPISGSPDASLPRNIGSFIFSNDSRLRISSLRRTFSFVAFGTSMPTVSRPAMFGTMRMLTALSDRARSLDTALSAATFVPGASFTWYSVITGPDSMPTTSPLSRYSRSASSRDSACSRTYCSSSSSNPSSGSSSRSSGGNLYPSIATALCWYLSRSSCVAVPLSALAKRTGRALIFSFSLSRSKICGAPTSSSSSASSSSPATTSASSSSSSYSSSSSHSSSPSSASSSSHSSSSHSSSSSTTASSGSKASPPPIPPAISSICSLPFLRRRTLPSAMSRCASSRSVWRTRAAFASAAFAFAASPAFFVAASDRCAIAPATTNTSRSNVSSRPAISTASRISTDPSVPVRAISSAETSTPVIPPESDGIGPASGASTPARPATAAVITTTPADRMNGCWNGLPDALNTSANSHASIAGTHARPTSFRTA